MAYKMTLEKIIKKSINSVKKSLVPIILSNSILLSTAQGSFLGIGSIKFDGYTREQFNNRVKGKKIVLTNNEVMLIYDAKTGTIEYNAQNVPVTRCINKGLLLEIYTNRHHFDWKIFGDTEIEAHSKDIEFIDYGNCNIGIMPRLFDTQVSKVIGGRLSERQYTVLKEPSEENQAGYPQVAAIKEKNNLQKEQGKNARNRQNKDISYVEKKINPETKQIKKLAITHRDSKNQDTAIDSLALSLPSIDSEMFSYKTDMPPRKIERNKMPGYKLSGMINIDQSQQHRLIDSLETAINTEMLNSIAFNELRKPINLVYSLRDYERPYERLQSDDYVKNNKPRFSGIAPEYRENNKAGSLKVYVISTAVGLTLGILAAKVSGNNGGKKPSDSGKTGIR